jgi:AbrB family looped-hinge helix DNA binding protein
MFRDLVRLRKRNQLTLPAEVTEKLGITEGALLELVMTDEGHVELRHARVVRAGSSEAEREESNAGEDVIEGRFTALQGSKEAREYMRQKRQQETARKLEEQLDTLRERMQIIDLELNSTKTAIRDLGSSAGRLAFSPEKAR